MFGSAFEIEFANADAECLFGYESGEMIGIEIGRLIGGADRQDSAAHLRRIFGAWQSSPGIRDLECTARRKDCSEFPLEISARPLETRDRTLAIAIVRDNVRRRAQSDALNRSRENLARAQRIAALGSFERNLLTGEVHWSDELIRIWGVSERLPVPAEALQELVHPADRQKFMENRYAALQHNPTPIDFRIIRPDGEERTLHREYVVQFDEKGKPTHSFGIIQDITERKAIEEELLRSREMLVRAQRVANIGSFDHNLLIDRAEWSDQLYRIWGLTRGGVEVPRPAALLPLVHPEDRAKFLAIEEQIGKGTPHGSADYRIRRPDGAERVLHRECDITFDRDGRPIRVFGAVQDITDSRAIEEALRRSQESLARAQRVAKIGNFEYDTMSGKTEWSNELYRLYGLTPGKTKAAMEEVTAVVHPEDREKFLSIRSHLAQGTRSGDDDFRVIHPDGSVRTLHREFDVLTDESGKAICVYGTLQDITERKRVELELARSRENMARAQRMAGIGSFEHDLATNEVQWSDEIYRIFGVEKGRASPGFELFVNLVHPEDRDRFLLCRSEEITGRLPQPLEVRIIRPDGTERILRRESAVVFHQDRRPARIFGTFQDVTERKRAELELLRSRENMARAQQIASMGSFDRDLITGKAEWSDEMFAILGLKPGGSVPGHEIVVSITHPEDRAALLASREAQLAGGPLTSLEYRIVRPDGVERIVRRESVVVFDDERRPIRLSGTLQDVTERRLAERHERDLEKQLLHSQKLEALGTMASGIAHDLNNTLVPIMALSKLMSRRFPSGDVARTNLEIIFEASKRGRDLIKRILAFSRKDETEKCPIDLAEIASEALKLQRATVPATIQFVARIAAVPPVLADASQIHQVIANLVANAAHAIGSEVGTITIGLDLLAGQQEIRLSVSDSGAGMDEATQQRIFEPFFTTKPVGQGTGLGLSIVHGIITSHGGRIDINSAPGRGTRFDVYFPVASAHRGGPPAEAISGSRPAA